MNKVGTGDNRYVLLGIANSFRASGDFTSAVQYYSKSIEGLNFPENYQNHISLNDWNFLQQALPEMAFCLRKVGREKEANELGTKYLAMMGQK